MLQEKQQASRMPKVVSKTALRNVEKSKMLIQSTKRMIEGNQGVSSNSKTLLKDSNVLGLLLSMLVVPKTTITADLVGRRCRYHVAQS